MTRIILAGPGRAGMSLAHAWRAAGHRMAGVLARRPEAARGAAVLLDCPVLDWDRDLPAADVLVVAVRDDAIAEVAGRLAGRAGRVGDAVHLSGLAGLAALDPLAGEVRAVGSFHPLQTLADPAAGPGRLAGAWVAVTAADPAAAARLELLAASIGARPFRLADPAKPLYHAGAAASANYVVLCLAMARDLLEAAGVPTEAARPLVEAVVDNVFTLGPREALTGPIARGDVGTVAAQLAAVGGSAPEWADAFAALGRELARYAGRAGDFEELFG